MAKTHIEQQLAKIEPLTNLKIALGDCSATEASIGIHLDGNRNDKNTMFAGSIYSSMVLAGWVLARMACDRFGGRDDVVIKESRITYLAPVRSNCTAKARLAEDLQEKDNGNVSIGTVVVLVDENGEECAEMVGQYVGLGRR